MPSEKPRHSLPIDLAYKVAALMERLCWDFWYLGMNAATVVDGWIEGEIAKSVSIPY